MTKLKSNIFEIINQVPTSKVASYGQISEVLAQEFEEFVRAQVVGWVLSGMKIQEYELCPWHRIVAKSGYIAALKLGSKGLLQIELLQKEGLNIIDNTVDMSKYCVQITDLLTQNIKQPENFKLFT